MYLSKINQRRRCNEHTRPLTSHLVLSLAIIEKEGRGEQHVKGKFIAIRHVAFLQRKKGGWMR